MNMYYLDATNARRWKYRRINLQLRHSNNVDKKFQRQISLNFKIIQSDTVKQLLRWYGKCYHFLNDTMLLDMIKMQVQNKNAEQIII